MRLLPADDLKGHGFQITVFALRKGSPSDNKGFMPDPQPFIERWQNAEAPERANAQLFLSELADLLGVPRPGNSHADGYSFEFPFRLPKSDSTFGQGRVDLYKRMAFVLEAKQFVSFTAPPLQPRN